MANKEFSEFAETNIKLRFRIVVRPSRDKNRKVLLEQEIVNPEKNKPIRLNIPNLSEAAYLDPLSAEMQIVSGDAATELGDAILSFGFKPRRTS